MINLGKTSRRREKLASPKQNRYLFKIQGLFLNITNTILIKVKLVLICRGLESAVSSVSYKLLDINYKYNIGKYNVLGWKQQWICEQLGRHQNLYAESQIKSYRIP